MKNHPPLLAGLLIGALAYWFQPYNQTTVLGLNMWLIMAIGALLASALLIHYLDQNPPKIALRVTLGVLLAILARIIYDTTLWDPPLTTLLPLKSSSQASQPFPTPSPAPIWANSSKSAVLLPSNR